MLLFNGFRKYLAAFFIAMFFATASLAAANDVGLQSASGIAQAMEPAYEPPTKTSVGISSGCFAGNSTNLGGVNAAFAGKDISSGSLNECFEHSAALPLSKDGDKVIWSLVPSFDRVSLNPIDDIKNIQIVLKYRF